MRRDRPSAESLARYLSGTAKDDESAAIRHWLSTNSEAQIALEGLESARPDAETELRRAIARIEHRAGSLRRPARVYTLWTGPVRAAAAIVALTTASALFVWYAAQRTDESAEMRSYETAPGQRMKLRLSDGTEIEMNVGSRLRVATDFGSSKRHVALEGEAYFNVASDSSRQFLVDAWAASVRVLGTAFNVNAYEDASDIAVVVSEGRVEMRAGVDGTSRAMLAPGDRGRAERTARPGDSISVTSVDPLLATGWRRGELVFTAATLDNVAATLSRWYDVDVVLTDYVLSSRRLDARFQNEPLEDVLESIGSALGVRYDIDGRHVTISPE